MPERGTLIPHAPPNTPSVVVMMHVANEALAMSAHARLGPCSSSAACFIKGAAMLDVPNLSI